MAQYQTFGHFVLFKEMHADEIGHLYRAAEINKAGIKRTVFLRVFDGPSLPQDDVVAAFDTANNVANVLHATNVAAGAQYFVEDRVPAVAWNHVAGQSLGGVFKKVRDEGFPVPVDNALLIMEKLALALSAGLAVELDGRPLVHGFLHPGMAVVTNDGEAIVSGFGMAERLLGLLDEAETAASCAPYVAPEILMTRTASKRGDVYSLGAILYHLLTSTPLPAEAEARAGKLEEAELAYDGEPIPNDIKSLLTRALAYRPEDRFSSAADFKKELDKLLYGGAYSPTTFNLALFMDRLFRSEIEAEEREKVTEGQIEVAQYLRPEPEPVPEEIVAAEATGGGKGLWIGLSVVIAAAVIAGAILWPRLMGPGQAVVPPTPTAEQLAEKARAEQERLVAMVDAEVQRLMAQKEEEIREELTARQNEIEKLRKQVKEADKRAQGGSQPSTADQQRAQELRRKLEQAEAAKRKREQELEQQRQEAAEKARRQAEDEARRLAEAAKPTPQPQVAEAVPSPAPMQPKPQPAATTAPVKTQPEQAGTTVVENMFVDPAEVDTRAEVLRQGQPEYSRTAIRSGRRGVAILQATVNAAGRVEDVRILRIDETGFGIPDAVKKAAMESLFKPATKNGVRVKSHASITYQYSFRR